MVGEPFGEPYVFDPCYWGANEEDGRDLSKLVEEVSGEIAVKDSDPSRKGKFSRVVGVDYASGQVIFPDLPASGSPSLVLYRNPLILKEAIRATHKLQVVELTGSVSHGSGVALCDTLLLTSARVALPNSSSRCRGGGFVRSEEFEMASKPRYNLETITRNEPTDFALMQITTDTKFAIPEKPELLTRFTYFVLPCSPVDKASCCITSFPGISSVLMRADGELLHGTIKGDVRLWEVYKGAMEEELEETRARFPYKTEADVEAIGKKLLFSKLHEVFGGHCTGVETASLGEMVMVGGSWRTTCSTLYGSSGGPVCPVNKYGYFWGWHSGATEDRRANLAYSCDEAVFVESYFKHVLGRLPPPEDGIWEAWDLTGFLDWIRKHTRANPQIQPSSSSSSIKWIHAASDMSRLKF